MVYFGHHFNFSISFGLIVASWLVCSWIGLQKTSQHYPVQHSTSLLHLQSIGFSQFFIWHVNLHCFMLFPFLPFSFHFSPFPTFSIWFVSPYKLFSFYLPLLDYLISRKNLCRYSEMMKNLFSLHFTSAVQS